MEKVDLDYMEYILDKYGLEETLSALSFICGEKAEHIAVNWQDTGLAKRWMKYSSRIDTLSSEFNKDKIRRSI